MRTNEVLTEMRNRAEARQRITRASVPVTRRSPTKPQATTRKQKAEPLTKNEAWSAIQQFADPIRVAEGLTEAVAIDRLLQDHPELTDLYSQAQPSPPPPIKARRKPGITAAQLVKSQTGQRWMPMILEKRKNQILKASVGSFGQRLLEEIEKLATELQKERTDLGDQEAFTAVVLAGMTSFASKDPVKLMWKWIEGPESDLELEIALGRPDIQAALAEVGLKL